jgi:hypothetical protein
MGENGIYAAQILVYGFRFDALGKKMGLKF